MNIKTTNKIVQEIQTGIHLVSLSKVSWLLDTTKEEKTILTNKDGEKAFEVVYVDKNNKTFRNIYWLGGEKKIKQKFFEQMLSHIGMNPKDTIKAKEMLKKSIWIAVCEVVDIDGDNIINDIEGNEVKQHYIFKTYPFIEGGSKPYIEGDPEIAGVPMYEFRKYRDVESSSYPKVSHTKEQKMTIAKEIINAPKVVEQRGKVEYPPITDEDQERIDRIKIANLQKASASMVPNKEFFNEKPVPVSDEPNFGDDVVESKVNSKTNVSDVWDDEPNFD